jgi:hypothetical protein
MLGDIGDVECRLHAEEKKRVQHHALLPAPVKRARRFALIERDLHLLQHRDQALRFLVAGHLRHLPVFSELLLDRLQIRQRQLGMDSVDIGGGIDLAGDVHHVGVVEGPHHVHDRVHLADVREELVAQSLALGCARDQAGDVHELDCRRNDLLRSIDLRELCEPQVGHLDDADVGLDGAERIVFRCDARFGQRIEQRGLAHVRQAHDPAAQAHFLVFENRDPNRPFGAGFCGGISTLGSGLASAFCSTGFSFSTGFSIEAGLFHLYRLFLFHRLLAVCSFIIAPCKSPARQSGSTSMPRAMAPSMASRSAADGFCRT